MVLAKLFGYTMLSKLPYYCSVGETFAAFKTQCLMVVTEICNWRKRNETVTCYDTIEQGR